jgi:hypothetical protein
MLKRTFLPIVPMLLGSLLLLGEPAVSQSRSSQPANPVPTGQPTGQWVSFQSDKGGFSVLMPSQPTERVQTLNTGTGVVNTYLFSTTLDGGSTNFTVSYVDLPKSVESMPENLVLEAIASGITGDERFKVLSERVIKLNDYNGREIKVESQKNSIVQHRTYVVKQRIYQIAVEVPAAKQNRLTGDVERFLNSFKLL